MLCLPLPEIDFCFLNGKSQHHHFGHVKNVFAEQGVEDCFLVHASVWQLDWERFIDGVALVDFSAKRGGHPDVLSAVLMRKWRIRTLLCSEQRSLSTLGSKLFLQVAEFSRIGPGARVFVFECDTFYSLQACNFNMDRKYDVFLSPKNSSMRKLRDTTFLFSVQSSTFFLRNRQFLKRCHA